MSFYPPVPISFSFSGEKNIAASLEAEGRKRAGELYNKLSGGYGNPHFDSIEERIFSGKSGPFYYLTASGYFVTINTMINGALTYVTVDAAPREDQVEASHCRCCRDCITIGEIVEKIYIYPGSQTGAKYVVDLCFQTSGRAPEKVRLIDGACPADGNHSFTVGEKYIVVANPALLNLSAEGESVPVSTDLRTWSGDQNLRQAKIWQVFDCMDLSDVMTEGVSLIGEGIDNSLYTVKSDICQKAGASVPIEDPEVSTSDPIPVVAIRFILTSIKVGDCLELRE